MGSMVKKKLGVIALATVVCLSGCSANTNNDVKVNSSSSSQEIGQKQIRTFTGTSKVKASDGHTWTPPAGSHQDKDGYIIDKDGCVIGQTGPLKIPSDAVG